MLAESMRRFGVRSPILARADGTIIYGHGRRLAALAIGLEVYPVVRAPAEWTDADCLAFMIADNEHALNSAWDIGLLKSGLLELQSLDFDMPALGFDDEDISKILGGSQIVGDPEEVPALPTEPFTRTGDLWLLGEHRLLCGDSTNASDVERLLGGEKPRLMVTDPPYSVNYDPSWRSRAGVNLNAAKLGKVENDDRADWTSAWRLFPGDVVYVWHGGLHAAEVAQSIENVGFKIRAQIVWAKDRFALSRGDYHWQHEPCWYAVRKGRAGGWAGDRSQSTLWEIAAREDGGHGHGTQKPLACMERPIVNSSRARDSVYEPFCGSGTTLIASEKTGRKCYAMEISPAYCDVTITRWEHVFGKKAVRHDGEPFQLRASE